MTDAEDLINAADSAITRRDLETAIELLSRLEGAVGRTPVTVGLQGRLALKTNNTARAIQIFEELSALQPDQGRPRSVLAQLHLHSGQWIKAAAYAKDALNAHLQPSEILPAAAIACMALYALGRQEEATKTKDIAVHRLDSIGHKLTDMVQDMMQADAALTCAICGGDPVAIENLYRFRFPTAKARVSRARVSPTTDIRAWCRQQDIEVRQIDAAARVAAGGGMPNSSSWRYDADPYEAALIPGGQLLSGWDYVVAPTGHVLADSGYQPINISFPSFPHAHLKPIAVTVHAWNDAPVDVDAAALFMSAPVDFQFGHWLVDFLPRLRALSVLKRQDFKVAVPAELPHKHRDLLALFDFPESRLINCALGKRYRFRELIVALPGDYMRPNPNNVKFVNAALMKKNAMPSQRLFLDRAVGTRRIVNQVDVEAVLAEFDIRHVDLARLSIAEQQALLGDAMLLIGAFGTDLLGVYFVPPGADIIELIWDTAQDPVVGPTCHILGVHHQFLLCAEAVESKHTRMKKDRDMVVDCAKLRDRIATIIQRKNAGAVRPL